MAEQPNTDEIEKTIRLVEIALTIGKHILHIMWLSFGITVASAVYDFATGNIVWGIIASIFAVAGFVFIAQVYETRNRHRQRRMQTKRTQIKSEYRESASA